MRPKLIALIAVSAVALVGCSAEGPSIEPSVTASEETRPASIEEITIDMDPALKEEAAFIHVAQMRATSHGLPKLDSEVLLEALHDFCDSGDSMNLTDSEYVNESLDEIASMGTCKKIQ